MSATHLQDKCKLTKFFSTKFVKFWQDAQYLGMNSPLHRVRLCLTEVWALTWLLQNIHLIVFKPFLFIFHYALGPLMESTSAPLLLLSCRLILLYRNLVSCIFVEIFPEIVQSVEQKKLIILTMIPILNTLKREDIQGEHAWYIRFLNCLCKCNI